MAGEAVVEVVAKDAVAAEPVGEAVVEVAVVAVKDVVSVCRDNLYKM